METSARNPLSEKTFFVPRLFVGKAGRGLTLALAASGVFPIQAQTSAASPQKVSATAGKGTMIPRTPWGAPDLNGVWNGNTMTPLERPDKYANKPFLTEQEAAALEKAQRDTALEDRPAREGDPGTYNQGWTDPAFKLLPDRRTSLIVDPPDGRIPFTPEGQRVEARSKARYGKGPYNSYLDLDTGERCITDGLPIYFGGYNNNYEIFQTRDFVAILHEYYHEARIIPLDGRPHDSISQWEGDGRGHWEGDTLVVETTKFADKGQYEWADAWRAARGTTHLIERFTRKANSIEYEFKWEDPTMFTRPWTARWPLSRQEDIGVTKGPIYEYACHEGNYALEHVLSGARAKEREDAARKGSSR
jgi:hypothetical protein